MSRLSNCSRIWNMNTPRMKYPDQHVEGDPQFHHHGHAVGRRGGRKKSAFSMVRKPITWGTALPG